jgi:hypothetical protein
MPHPLLDLLNITEQDCRKAGLTEAEVVKKIITDNLVTLRAQECRAGTEWCDGVAP